MGRQVGTGQGESMSIKERSCKYHVVVTGCGANDGHMGGLWGEGTKWENKGEGEESLRA